MQPKHLETLSFNHPILSLKEPQIWELTSMKLITSVDYLYNQIIYYLNMNKDIKY